MTTTFISLISTFAALIGLLGIGPQLWHMLRARSSAGQSAFAWALGASANAALAFVNLAGYHARVLAAGNLLSFAGCVAAVYLVRRLRNGDGATQAAALGTEQLDDLHTHEFVALREAVLHEHRRRTGEPCHGLAS